MLFLTKTDYPDFEAYEKNISGDLYVLFDYKKLFAKVSHIRSLKNTLERQLMDYMEYSTGTRKSINRDNIIDLLLDYENVPEDLLLNKRGDSFSLDQSKVLKPLHKKGFAEEFLEKYFDYQLFKVADERISSTMTRMKKVGEENRLLGKLDFVYNRKATMRYYTENENIQAISKIFLDSMTVEEDWIMYWMDLPQIDLRVAYNTILREDNEEVDKIFKEVEDKYEAIARILTKKLDLEFNLEEFKRNRDNYKVAFLAKVYGAHEYTLKQSINDDDFLNMLDNFMKKNEAYQNFVEELKLHLTYSDSIEIMDYFGVSSEVEVLKRAPYLTLDSALNRPVQTTSNSIIVHQVNYLMEKFRGAGVPEDKVRIYLIKHDEIVVKLHKDYLGYSYVFEEINEVIIDDWAPIKAEGKLGYYYGVEDKGLMDLHEKNVRKNQDKWTRVIGSSKKKYSPVKLVRAYAAKKVGDRVILLSGRKREYGYCRNYDEVFDYVEGLAKKNVGSVRLFTRDIMEGAYEQNGVRIEVDHSNSPLYLDLDRRVGGEV